MIKEGFDIETVVQGEPPTLLPDGGGASDELTIEDVRLIVRVTLEEDDAAQN
jgi:hypothetical protein